MLSKFLYEVKITGVSFIFYVNLEFSQNVLSVEYRDRDWTGEEVLVLKFIVKVKSKIIRKTT